jgi:hypothetical protein
VNEELPTDGILHVLNDYGKRHLKTSLMYQLAKSELQALLEKIHQKEGSK